jgi:hypothetical protein
VANLSGTAPAGSPSANGSVLLVASGAGRTVFDDNAVDTLTGNAGFDWFIFNSVGGPFVDQETDLGDDPFEGMFDIDL